MSRRAGRVGWSPVVGRIVCMKPAFLLFVGWVATTEVWPAVGAEAAPARPVPTHAEVRYGPHERHVFDLWLPRTGRPAPLAVYIHGGGFSGGSKERLPVADLERLLASGIAVASLHYRFLQQAKLPAAHHDVARAVQTIRHRAAEWRLDPQRVGAFGGSAGAQLALFLALHDDLADPASADPVARQSTRLTCAAGQGAQGAMDMEWMDTHIPGAKTRPSRLPDVAAWNAKWFGVDGEAARRIVAKTSAVALLSPDDPPLFLSYGMAPDSVPPADAQARENWISHHVAHGLAIKRRADDVGVAVQLRFPGAGGSVANAADFLREKLGAGLPPKGGPR